MPVTEVIVKHFKRFEDQRFVLDEAVVLAGPNNMGKTTLLQAILTWKFGLERWIAQRGEASPSVRSGVSITRQELTAMPLREMNLMWHDRRVAAGGKGTAARMVEISVRGIERAKSWEYALEFQYANSELLYVRPAGALDRTTELPAPPAAAREMRVVHVPAMAGLARDEPVHDRRYQEHLIGQGRAGECLRNLLLEVADEPAWEELVGHMHELFRVELQRPAPGDPFIVCEYREAGRGRPMDLANAGSGLLQVLLVLAFFYARPATVLLMDEPDAHLHVILEKEVYELLRRIAAERGSQLIIASHSEILLDATDPERVLAFIGDEPRRLTTPVERDRLREALKRLTTTDLLLARDVGGVLYLEWESDERILSVLAETLDHPAQGFLKRPYVHRLGGRMLREAKEHFFALQAVSPAAGGLCILDGDNREEPDEETTRSGLKVLRWRRYEIESYLLIPEAIGRYCTRGEPAEDLFSQAAHESVDTALADYLAERILRDPLGDHELLRSAKASDDLLMPLLRDAGRPTPKRDLYLLARELTPAEIHPEIAEKLDAIAELAADD
jgi:hypothetical protein